jgi:hypothetical protein
MNLLAITYAAIQFLSMLLAVQLNLQKGSGEALVSMLEQPSALALYLRTLLHRGDRGCDLTAVTGATEKLSWYQKAIIDVDAISYLLMDI